MAILVGLLSGCKKGEETGEVPAQYSIGEDTVLALTPGEDESELSVEERVEEESIITYQGLADVQETCTEYLETLTDEENGFRVVDEELVEAETPDLTAEEGSVYLAKAASEEGQVCVMLLEWAEDTCTITLNVQEGTIQEAPPTEKLNLTTAVEYLESLPPDAIGLEGSSMDQYQIYAVDGVIFVDGNPCLHLKVYRSDNPEKTNEVSGDFLLTGDKRHLFSLDAVNGTVKEISV
jgi:hypothetical protein